MEAIDEAFQPNMGQRVELTFTDAKIINLAYCTGECNSISSKNGIHSNTINKTLIRRAYMVINFRCGAVAVSKHI